MQVDLARLEEQVLPLVTKPGRYIGRELHADRKPHGPGRVSVLLAFPDAYEIGMSHIGLKILCHLVNGRDDALAEYVFCPWPDMESQLRSKNIPLFSLQTRTPARSFDILGISLQHELHYPNALNLLDLAGIPTRAEDRTEEDPLVVAGGPCCFNPMPMAPFVDAFAIGDGEEIILELVDAVGRSKREKLSRGETLARLDGISGLWVPSLSGDPEGGSVQARFVSRLDRNNYPTCPPVPLMDIAHNRLGVEIMRGCTRGCRFCQAGMIRRPLREMAPEDVEWLALEGVKSGGWDEVALISLSTSDYSRIEPLMDRLTLALQSRRVGVCLPSLRPGGLTDSIARSVSRFRHPGLTFAPEAGTARLRRVINKEFEEEALLEAVRVAGHHGWRQIKLYFMVGLPTEEEEDLAGMADLAQRMVQPGGGRRGPALKMSVSPFIPKPHTPFQWEPQVTVEEVKEKIRFLKRMLRGLPVQLRWPRMEMTVVEGILARGDRRLNRVIERVWESGGRFEGWTDFFSFDRWESALSEEELSVDESTGARSVDEPLPWDLISTGVSRRFLLAERERALRAEATPDCRETGCHGCMQERPASVCSPITLSAKRERKAAALSSGLSGRQRRAEPAGPPMGVRLRYAKVEEARFTSHLDVVRVLTRAVRRAEIPALYSTGFSSRPRVTLGPPLPLGMTSRAEYLDLRLVRPWREEDARPLAEAFPPGFELLETHGFVGKVQALAGAGARDRYRVTFDPYLDALDPPPDPGAWWKALRERSATWVALEEKPGEEEPAKKGEIRAKLISVSVGETDGGPRHLLISLLTGSGLRRVLESTIQGLAKDDEILPLVRIDREAYNLWDGARWVSPMECVFVTP